MLPDPGTNAGAGLDAWIAMRMPGRDVEVELGDLFSDDHEVTVPRRLRRHARAVGHSAAFGRNKYKHTLHDIRVAEIFSPPRVVPPLESRGKGLVVSETLFCRILVISVSPRDCSGAIHPGQHFAQIFFCVSLPS